MISSESSMAKRLYKVSILGAFMALLTIRPARAEACPWGSGPGVPASGIWSAAVLGSVIAIVGYFMMKRAHKSSIALSLCALLLAFPLTGIGHAGSGLNGQLTSLAQELNSAVNTVRTQTLAFLAGDTSARLHETDQVIHSLQTNTPADLLGTVSHLVKDWRTAPVNSDQDVSHTIDVVRQHIPAVFVLGEIARQIYTNPDFQTMLGEQESENSIMGPLDWFGRLVQRGSAAVGIAVGGVHLAVAAMSLTNPVVSAVAVIGILTVVAFSELGIIADQSTDCPAP